MVGLTSFAEGKSAQIILNQREGVCYRQFSSGTWDPMSARNELRIHAALTRAGIDTMQVYQLDQENHRIRMTDLSGGGINFVMTTPDRYQIYYQGGNEALERWFQITNNRPFYNVADFFDQLKTIVKLAQNNRILLHDNSFAFVLSPQGIGKTFIVDYGDGVSLNPLVSRREIAEFQVNFVRKYLELVAEFFPVLREHIETFTGELTVIS